MQLAPSALKGSFPTQVHALPAPQAVSPATTLLSVMPVLMSSTSPAQLAANAPNLSLAAKDAPHPLSAPPAPSASFSMEQPVPPVSSFPAVSNAPLTLPVSPAKVASISLLLNVLPVALI